MVSDGISVWIANGNDGTWMFPEKPVIVGGSWNGSGVADAENYRHLVPHGECREFRLVPVGETQSTPQPVTVSLAEYATNIAIIKHQIEVFIEAVDELQRRAKYEYDSMVD